MDADFDGEGFRLLPIETPCCGASLTLNKLCYHWHCAFGRLSVEVLNPGVHPLPDALMQELARRLDGPVALVYAHL